MRRWVAVAAVAVVLAAGGCSSKGHARFSEEFRTNFLQRCASQPGGTLERCECALDYLEEHAETEADIRPRDVVNAVRSCENA